jgi:hypothetical protein
VEVIQVSDASAEDIVGALTAVGLTIDEARRGAAAIFRGRLRRAIAGVHDDRDWIGASLDAEQFAAIDKAAAALESQPITYPPSVLRAAFINLGTARHLEAPAQSSPAARVSPDERAGRTLAVDKVTSRGLTPLTPEQWVKARQALGRGCTWLLFGTSKKALDNAVTRVQQAARGNVQQRSQSSTA